MHKCTYVSVSKDWNLLVCAQSTSKRAAATVLIIHSSSAGKMKVKDHFHLMAHWSSTACTAPAWSLQLILTGFSLCAKLGLHTNSIVQTAVLCRQMKDGSSDECTSRDTSWWQRQLDAAQRNQMTPHCPPAEQSHVSPLFCLSHHEAWLFAAVTEG